MGIIKADDIHGLVTQYLVEFQRYYPGIMEWFAKVKKELPTGRRSLAVAMEKDKLVGLAITKNGPSAKLCHISVSSPARKRGIGGALMQNALQGMIRHGAVEIRVTTSEEVCCRHGSFFSTVGFEAVDWQVNRYRHDVSEVFWRRRVIIPGWRQGDSRDAVSCNVRTADSSCEVSQLSLEPIARTVKLPVIQSPLLKFDGNLNHVQNSTPLCRLSQDF